MSFKSERSAAIIILIPTLIAVAIAIGSAFLRMSATAYEGALVVVNGVPNAQPGENIYYIYEFISGDNLFLAIPRTSVFKDVDALITFIAVSALSVIAVIIFIILFFVLRQRKTVGKIISALDYISEMGLDTEGISSDISPYIGNRQKKLAMSLLRIDEHMKANAVAHGYVRERYAIFSYILNLLEESPSIDGAFHSIALMLSKNYNIKRVSIVYSSGGNMILSAMYEKGFGFHCEEQGVGSVFKEHGNVIRLLSKKNILYLNKYLVGKSNLSFWNSETVSAYIVPLKFDYIINGYIFFENNDIKKSITPEEEGLYLYVAKTLSEWVVKRMSKEDSNAREIKYRENNVDYMPYDETTVPYEESKILYYENEIPDIENIIQPKASDCPEPFLPADIVSAARSIDSINVDLALSVMGNLPDVYEEGLKITIQLIPSTIEKLDKFLEHNDMRSFAIEVHGEKSALRSIGCMEQGNAAEKLEYAAKANDLEFCRINYPLFKEYLLELYQLLNPYLAPVYMEKEPGDETALSSIIASAKEATENYDSDLALELLEGLVKFSFNPETDAKIEEAINSLNLFNYSEAIGLMEEILS